MKILKWFLISAGGLALLVMVALLGLEIYNGHRARAFAEQAKKELILGSQLMPFLRAHGDFNLRVRSGGSEDCLSALHRPDGRYAVWSPALEMKSREEVLQLLEGSLPGKSSCREIMLTYFYGSLWRTQVHFKVSDQLQLAGVPEVKAYR